MAFIEKFRKAVVPHLIGLGLMVGGWFISIVDIGLNKFTANPMMNTVTWTGLLMVLIGAYLPEIWIGIRERRAK